MYGRSFRWLFGLMAINQYLGPFTTKKKAHITELMEISVFSYHAKSSGNNKEVIVNMISYDSDKHVVWPPISVA